MGTSPVFISNIKIKILEKKLNLKKNLIFFCPFGRLNGTHVRMSCFII